MFIEFSANDVCDFGFKFVVFFCLLTDPFELINEDSQNFDLKG